MYTPQPFKISSDDEAKAFLQANRFGQLISMVNGRLFSTHIPFQLDEKGNKLRCHLAKANPQWKEIEKQEVLITFQGPHDYISPSWYESAGVPTWNYQAVHIYGSARTIEEPTELKKLVEEITEAFESQRQDPWNIEFSEKLLDAIIGIEIDIKEVQCKYKLSQNRSKTERVRITEELSSKDSSALSSEMKKLQQD
jgi:transcriptional regulator